MSDIKDFTIIGGGPTGLFAAFYSAMRGNSVRIVDSLPELGGQLQALYPEKYVYDVGGFPKVLAKDLVKGLVDQAMQFDPEVVLDEEIRTITRDGDHFVMQGRTGTHLTRSVLIAGGKGAFEPMTLDVPGYTEFLHNGVHYSVKDPEVWRGKNVVIVGGGDSALDWALILKDLCGSVKLLHRRDSFRAHEHSVTLMEQACADGSMEFMAFHEVSEIHGEGTVKAVTVFDNRSEGSDRKIEADAVMTFLGFKPDLGPIRNWGIELDKNRIKVDPLMQTNIEGIYAAGDIVDYEGKLDLIATGFAEAAIAANAATRYVNPDARANPGHSTSNAAFK